MIFKSISIWRIKYGRDFFLLNSYSLRRSQQVKLSSQMKTLYEMQPWDLDFIYIDWQLEKWADARVRPRSAIGQEWSETIPQGQEIQVRKRKSSLIMDTSRVVRVRFYLGKWIIEMRDPEKGFGKKFSGPRVKRCGEYTNPKYATLAWGLFWTEGNWELMEREFSAFPLSA